MKVFDNRTVQLAQELVLRPTDVPRKFNARLSIFERHDLVFAREDVRIPAVSQVETMAKINHRAHDRGIGDSTRIPRPLPCTLDAILPKIDAAAGPVAVILAEVKWLALLYNPVEY